MTILVKKIILNEQPSSDNTSPLSLPYTEALSKVTVQCDIRIGTTQLTVKELQELRLDSPIVLEQKTNEPVDILLNNHIIARGELMCVEENFAVKITELYS